MQNSVQIVEFYSHLQSHRKYVYREKHRAWHTIHLGPPRETSRKCPTPSTPPTTSTAVCHRQNSPDAGTDSFCKNPANTASPHLPRQTPFRCPHQKTPSPPPVAMATLRGSDQQTASVPRWTRPKSYWPGLGRRDGALWAASPCCGPRTQPPSTPPFSRRNPAWSSRWSPGVRHCFDFPARRCRLLHRQTLFRGRRSLCPRPRRRDVLKWKLVWLDAVHHHNLRCKYFREKKSKKKSVFLADNHTVHVALSLLEIIFPQRLQVNRGAISAACEVEVTMKAESTTTHRHLSIGAVGMEARFGSAWKTSAVMDNFHGKLVTMRRFFLKNVSRSFSKGIPASCRWSRMDVSRTGHVVFPIRCWYCDVWTNFWPLQKLQNFLFSRIFSSLKRERLGAAIQNGLTKNSRWNVLDTLPNTQHWN